MKYNPENQHRRSNRLRGYDYSQPGYYFVTLCTKNREYLFGEIKENQMILNEIGRIINRQWKELTFKYSNINNSDFIIMPNHIHGVIELIRRGLINQTPTLENNENWILMKNPEITLGKIIRFFKAKSAFQIRSKSNIFQIWQRNYYEHIVRNENDLNQIREYIQNNPYNWKMDENNIKIIK